MQPGGAAPRNSATAMPTILRIFCGHIREVSARLGNVHDVFVMRSLHAVSSRDPVRAPHLVHHEGLAHNLHPHPLLPLSINMH